MFIEDVQRWLTEPPKAEAVPELPEGFDLDGRREVVWRALEELEGAIKQESDGEAWQRARRIWTSPGRLEAWLAAFVAPFYGGVGKLLEAQVQLRALDAGLRAEILGEEVRGEGWSWTLAGEVERVASEATRRASAALDVATWARENCLQRPDGGPTSVGQALCALRGRDAVEFALAVGVELSVGPWDPWRLSAAGLVALSRGTLQFDATAQEDSPSPFEFVAVARLADMGLAHSYPGPFLGDVSIHAWDCVTLHDDARDLVLRVATEPDSRFRALARTLLDIERGRVTVEATGRGTVDLGDMNYARSVAHDIRNMLYPLNAALAGLREELGRPDPDHVRRDQLWARIQATMSRLNEFASDAVRLSAAIAPEELVLIDVVQESVRATEPERNGRISVIVDISGAVVLIGARRDWVSALVNLLRNAAQVRDGKGSVWVSTQRDDAGGLHIFVDDDGPGVPEELRERVFDLGQSSRGGSGLGLTSAMRTARASFGTLTCESSPRGGARFHFALPRRSLA